MPHRASSRSLLLAGTGLVALACALITGPALWGRAATSDPAKKSAEIDRIGTSIDHIRDAVDILRDTLITRDVYLLTGSAAARADYRAGEAAARHTLAALDTTAIGAVSMLQFGALGDSLLSELARVAALQDDGRRAEAVTAVQLDTDRALITQIDAMARRGISDQRGRYKEIVAALDAATDHHQQLAQVLLVLAGATFALGCIALAVYQRRHLTAEAQLRAGRDY